MKHCIVTPELAPLVRNGGVGTNARHLARFLTEHGGHEVTILLAREIENAEDWDAGPLEQELGVGIVLLQRLQFTWDIELVKPRDLGFSLQAMRWL